jgi:hypothetical protein
MTWWLLAAALPLDLGVASTTAPSTRPGPPGLEVRVSTRDGRYAIEHTWRGAKPMRFVTGATDRNCDQPIDVLVVDGRPVRLWSELPCGGFAFRAARVVSPGQSWTLSGPLDAATMKRPFVARYCATTADLETVAPEMRRASDPPWWLGCAESPAPSKGAAMTTETLTASRATSPWSGLTASWDEEQRGMTVAAAAIAPSDETVDRLRAYAVDGEPAIAIDRAGRRVLLNQRWFGEVKRVDGTSLPAGARHTLGLFPKAPWPPRTLARFVVEAELVKTYAHLESRLTLVEEEDSAERWRARVDGTHVYYTSSRHESPVRFTFELDKKSGRLDVIGR